MNSIISTITGLYLVTAATVESPRRIELHIFVGRDCGATGDMFTPDWRQCATRNVAELVIDGKIVGAIPTDDLSPAELQKLNDTLTRFR